MPFMFSSVLCKLFSSKFNHAINLGFAKQSGHQKNYNYEWYMLDWYTLKQAMVGLKTSIYKLLSSVVKPC